MSQAYRLIALLVIALISGLSSALFLHTLDATTKLREAETWWLLFLPVIGLFLGWVYRRFETNTVGGPDLPLQAYHNQPVHHPARSAWLIYGATLLSHLAGASVGREGTAVQMSTGLSAFLERWQIDRQKIIRHGLAGGFAAVFGVPWAGVLFSVELTTGLKKASLKEVFSLAIVAWLAHGVVILCGVGHLHLPTISLSSWTNGMTALLVVMVALGSGFVARTYLFLLFGLKKVLRPSNPLLKGFLGGLVLLALYFWLSPGLYAGLGVNVIENSFVQVQGLEVWAIKLALTAFSLAVGFRGGEVTPLFCIGASFGSAFGAMLGAPIEVAAAVGFISVLGATLKTPWCGVLLGAELFGWSFLPISLICVWLAYFSSGTNTLYEYHPRNQRA